MKASLHMYRNISFHPILLNVKLKLLCLRYLIVKYAIGKLLCVYVFKESFHSGIKYDGYLITSTYCIEEL